MAAQAQWGGLIDLQALSMSTAPGMSGLNSDGSEEPAPLAFRTGDPESEPDDDANGVAVEAGLYPTVELDDDAKTQLPELGLAVTSIAVPPKSQLDGAGFLW